MIVISKLLKMSLMILCILNYVECRHHGGGVSGTNPKQDQLNLTK